MLDSRKQKKNFKRIKMRIKTGDLVKVINGKEKVILSQEKKINNILYINSQNDEQVPIQGILKSISKEGFQSSRTNAISLNKMIHKINPMNEELAIKEKTPPNAISRAPIQINETRGL